jgi:hypothetical protein
LSSAILAFLSSAEPLPEPSPSEFDSLLSSLLFLAEAASSANFCSIPPKSTSCSAFPEAALASSTLSKFLQ